MGDARRASLLCQVHRCPWHSITTNFGDNTAIAFGIDSRSKPGNLKVIRRDEQARSLGRELAIFCKQELPLFKWSSMLLARCIH